MDKQAYRHELAQRILADADEVREGEKPDDEVDTLKALATELQHGCNAISLLHADDTGKNSLELSLLSASQQVKKIVGEGVSDTQDIVIANERQTIRNILDHITAFGIDAGVFGLGKKALDRPVIIASVQALQSNEKELSRILNIKDISLLIGDEVGSLITQKRIEVFKFFSDVLRIGLTSTLPQSHTMKDFWGEIIDRRILQAGENGFFLRNGKKYGTVFAWGKFLNFSRESIQLKLKKAKKRGISGKDINGRVRKNAFYEEKDVFEVCGESVSNTLPRADEKGFFTQDGMCYGHITAWKNDFAHKALSYEVIEKRLKDNGIQKIPGTLYSGKVIVQFFSEEDVRRVCADYIEQSYPQADEEGFFNLENGKYGTIFAWSKCRPISRRTLKRRLEKAKEQGISGKDCRGKLQQNAFYHYEQIGKVT